jgi:hypothetical protein
MIMYSLFPCFPAALVSYKGRDNLLLSVFFPYAFLSTQIVSTRTTSIYRVDQCTFLAFLITWCVYLVEYTKALSSSPLRANRELSSSSLLHNASFMLTGPSSGHEDGHLDVQNPVVNAASHNQLELAPGELLDQQSAATEAEEEPPDAPDWAVSLPKEVDSCKNRGTEEDKESTTGRQLVRGSQERLKYVEIENSKLKEVIHHRIQQVIKKAKNVH